MGFYRAKFYRFLMLEPQTDSSLPVAREMSFRVKCCSKLGEVALKPVEEGRTEGERVIAELARSGGDAARILNPLTIDDCAVVGIVVQTTAQGFFAAQQLIELVEQKERENIRPWKEAPRDNQVFQLLIDYIPALGLSEDDAAILLDAISKLQWMEKIRHHVAHAALRRHPKVDALIGLSLRRRENFRKGNIEPRYGEVMTVYISVPEVKSKFTDAQEAVNTMTTLFAKIAEKP